MQKTAVNQLDGLEVLSLFKGWFNNKMMIILLISQYPNLKRKNNGMMNQFAFLFDLEHHYLIETGRRRFCRNAIRWLKAFLKICPERISAARSQKAFAMIIQIYRSFGFSFSWGGKIYG